MGVHPSQQVEFGPPQRTLQVQGLCYIPRRRVCSDVSPIAFRDQTKKTHEVYRCFSKYGVLENSNYKGIHHFDNLP